MMELVLNLLPQEKKRETKFIVALALTKDTILRLAIIIFFLLFFLMLINLTLDEQLSTLETSSSLVNKGYANYNFEVAEINKKISSINVAGKKIKVLTPRLLELMEKTPNNISLNELHLDIQTVDFNLPGTAKTRDNLLSFQDILNNMSWITETSLPKSQLFQKDDLPFQIQLKTTPLEKN